jgi:hypothetical protein
MRKYLKGCRDIERIAIQKKADADVAPAPINYAVNTAELLNFNGVELV